MLGKIDKIRLPWARTQRRRTPDNVRRQSESCCDYALDDLTDPEPEAAITCGEGGIE